MGVFHDFCMKPAACILYAASGKHKVECTLLLASIFLWVRQRRGIKWRSDMQFHGGKYYFHGRRGGQWTARRQLVGPRPDGEISIRAFPYTNTLSGAG
jgi:hypothetical protein